MDSVRHEVPSGTVHSRSTESDEFEARIEADAAPTSSRRRIVFINSFCFCQPGALAPSKPKYR
jgi:hypothetical protein